MLNEITVEMDNKPPSIDDSNSSEDYSREEEKWTKRHNEFLQKMCDDSKSISIKHNIASKYKLYYYRALSTQTSVAPHSAPRCSREQSSQRERPSLPACFLRRQQPTACSLQNGRF